MRDVYLVRTVLGALALSVIGYPLVVWYSGVYLTWDSALLSSLFPAFGLIAFTTMYLHIMGRPFAAWLENYVPFRNFERVSSNVVLVFIVLHPLLRTIYFVVKDIPLSPSPAVFQPIVLGFVGFFMLISYDIGRAFFKSEWVRRRWGSIDIVSTLGFYVIWMHALMIGSDLQVEPLRTIWIAYGISAAAASGYVFLIQKRSA